MQSTAKAQLEPRSTVPIRLRGRIFPREAGQSDRISSRFPEISVNQERPSVQQQLADEIWSRLPFDEASSSDGAQVRSLLTPFITTGGTMVQGEQLGVKSSRLRRLSTWSPMSLGALQSAGALDPSDQGLELLYYAGGYRGNLRKKGGFPAYNQAALKADQTVRWQVERAQQFLIKYGRLMVTEGMLLE